MGAVVLALDEYGHGSTEIGLLNRGFVNHRVKVNFGEEEFVNFFKSFLRPELVEMLF